MRQVAVVSKLVGTFPADGSGACTQDRQAAELSSPTANSIFAFIIYLMSE